MLKVFCAGMPRTATKSLNEALTILGYRTRHFALGLFDLWNPPDDWDIFGDLEAISDVPHIRWWREIYDQHQCKVILTLRDADAWFGSMVRNIIDTQGGDPMTNTLLYGHGYPHRRRWTEHYRKHNHAVRCGVRAADLLILDITAGDGWEKLCAFLDRPAPNETPFPHI